ncbi:MAG TPA: hypothetical protein VMU69_19345, partial [Bradyrhizobium sp.]|nr:hypothetical protein [Bradyrhizobium sp.]
MAHLPGSFGQGGKAICNQGLAFARFVRIAVGSIQLPKAFQAEYEGSIPFTRSNDFNYLERRLGLVPRSQAEPGSVRMAIRREPL